MCVNDGVVNIGYIISIKFSPPLLLNQLDLLISKDLSLTPLPKGAYIDDSVSFPIALLFSLLWLDDDKDWYMHNDIYTLHTHICIYLCTWCMVIIFSFRCTCFLHLNPLIITLFKTFYVNVVNCCQRP